MHHIRYSVSYCEHFADFTHEWVKIVDDLPGLCPDCEAAERIRAARREARR